MALSARPLGPERPARRSLHCSSAPRSLEDPERGRSVRPRRLNPLKRRFPPGIQPLFAWVLRSCLRSYVRASQRLPRHPVPGGGGDVSEALTAPADTTVKCAGLRNGLKHVPTTGRVLDRAAHSVTATPPSAPSAPSPRQSWSASPAAGAPSRESPSSRPASPPPP